MKKGMIIMAALMGTLSVMAQIKPTVSVKPAVNKTTTTASHTKPVIAATNSAVMKDIKDSASYALGYLYANNIASQGIDLALFAKGVNAAVQKKSLIVDSLLESCIKTYQDQLTKEKDKLNKEKIAINRAAGKAFLEENAKKPGVVKMTNGMQYLVLTEGTGTVKPTLKSKVKCHYHGTLIDGTVFDSSVQRGEPISFPLNGVIKGWQDAVQLMTVGAKWRLFIPSELAYGERSAGPVIGPGSTLIFDVELLDIE